MLLRQLAVYVCLVLVSAATAVAQSRVPDGFEDTVLLEGGLVKPTSLAVAPDGRLFITEKEGRLRVVRDGVLQPAPFLSVAVDSSFERGLLGVALAPAPPGDATTATAVSHVFVYYTLPDPDAPWNRLSRFTPSAANPDVADPASEVILLDNIPSGTFHNGGALHFLPDGTLLLAVGDGGTPDSAQSPGALTGKLLRVDTSGQAPPDNPFVGDPTARPEVWALGLRNPFTFAVEPGTGRVFANDVGTANAEEINHVVPGGNYGWPFCEGACAVSGTESPLFFYNHSQGCAVTGALFGAGLRFPPEYEGIYFYSDYCGRWMQQLLPEGEVRPFAKDMSTDVVDIDVGPEGNLIYLSHETGVVRQIEFVGEGNHKPRAAATAVPEAGPSPLTVVLNATESWDPDDDPLTFEWDTGDGAPVTAEPVRTHSYARDGAYTARVTVDDGRGGHASARVGVRVGNGPAARIVAPLPGATFRPGEVLVFEGQAQDPEDGPLPPTSLSWYLELHHHPEDDPLHHAHPLLGPVSGAGGSLQVPDLHDEDVWIRVWLTATDSSGLSERVFVDVLPRHD